MPIPTINVLVTRIARTDPFDSQANLEFLETLKSVRSSLQDSGPPAALEGLDGAILLLHFHVRTEFEGGSELMAVLLRMVKFVQLNLLQGSGATHVPGTMGLEEPMSINPVNVVQDMQLGQILLRMGYVNEDEINECLAYAKGLGIPFGQGLLENNVVGEDPIREALSYQKACREAAVTREAPQVSLPLRRTEGQRVIKSNSAGDCESGQGLRLLTDVARGELLTRGSVITHQQLEEARLCQRATGVRLGEALVSAGACSWSDVESALNTQAKMRRCG